MSKCRAIVPNRSRRRTPSATEEPDWGQSGYNWEQRFGCREILDEQALLACMVYVDLNQIKAGMAATLEDSRTSAIAARLAAWRAREAQASLEEFHSSRSSRGGGYDLSLQQIEALLQDAWLDPDRWTAAVDNFDEWFGRAVGSVARLRALLDRTVDRWVKGLRNCRARFG